MIAVEGKCVNLEMTRRTALVPHDNFVRASWVGPMTYLGVSLMQTAKEDRSVVPVCAILFVRIPWKMIRVETLSVTFHYVLLDGPLIMMVQVAAPAV
ncbi:hypothetical protein HOLleu_07964 [Holothuria leucospilota]|uniref:Uncharacterized protein n=1 Tax=Holothuria leucospilota TaxID=206669 RepID=A0A9Q1CGT1_HOLLE|nr:hypothetical protein HOLleu_07964 [Holothuria leucospilota]